MPGSAIVTDPRIGIRVLRISKDFLSAPVANLSTRRLRTLCSKWFFAKDWGNMTFKEFAREFSTGCLGHFFVGVAAAALLGIGAHHLGLPRLATFALVVVVIFSISVLFPGAKRKHQ